MTTKDYGAGVSGYLDPDGRNFETVVYQASKPVLDKELNDVQDIAQDAVNRLQKKAFSSGWLSDNFLNSSLTGVFNGTVTTANLLNVPTMTAAVNGWTINVSYTANNTGINGIDLGAGPAGAGAKRTDLVVLEVWRRLLSASPSTTGKSPSGRIWRNGNVKVPSADDLTLNYADDILDGAVGSETTKRVQVQYRLRVVTGVDIYTYPFGINDPAVVANTVPASAAAPNGTATAFTYSNQSVNGDPGLWRAGNGSPANGLGTVDGYMYSVPLCVVFRRNTTAFNRNTNHNGGVAYPGPSTRPDSLFTDIIAERDILDLRTGVSPTGWNLPEVLQKNLNLLFDNLNQTEIMRTTLGGGVDGHTVMWADEIGVSNANGGDGTTTGDTPGAEFIGEFDAVRRSFSDKSIYETVVLRYTPTGATWANGEVVNISPSALPIWPYSAFNWAAYAPSGVSLVGITRVAYMGEAGGQNSVDVTNTGTHWKCTGLGGVPQGNVTFTVTSTVGGAAPLYITMVVSYPSGVGLTKTPTTTLTTNATVPTNTGVFINNPGQLPAGAPILYSALETPIYKAYNREVGLTYRTVSHTRSYFSTGATQTLLVPERPVSGTISITINAAPYGGSISVNSDGYSIGIDSGAVTGGQTVVITYQTRRPLPQNGEQLTVYYEARAPQTIRDGLLSNSLQLIPRLVSDQIYILTAGSGSDGQAYPFSAAYVQSGGIYPSSGGSFAGDHELDGSLRVSTTYLFTDTGFQQLPVNIPVVLAPDGMTLTRAPGETDIEGRTYYKQVSGSYLPMAVAATLSDPKKHKNVLPILCEVAADGPFGQKGQMVLVLLTRWGTFDDSNSVLFNNNLTQNTTCASVFRLKGSLLSSRRS